MTTTETDIHDARPAPWRSADLSDRDPLRPIPTRLPAGLTESDLLTGYARPAQSVAS